MLGAIFRLYDTITEQVNPSAKANGPIYRSRFGGLWPDRSDARLLAQKKLALGEIDQAMFDQLQFWMEYGYVIIKDAVSHDDIDEFTAQMSKAWEQRDPRFKVQTGNGQYTTLQDVERNRALVKLLDTYAFSDAAKRMSFSPKIQQFIATVFEQDILAFQNLTFEVGSTQSIHQDTAYVVVSDPMKLVASWIALEDIQEGSGELVYYPGSHKLPDYIYSGKFKHWNPKRDGDDAHNTHLGYLHHQSKEMGLSMQKFRPKKGDALIWSADLAHGGGEITAKNVTRKSYVTHYCPTNIAPNYFSYAPEFNFKQQVKKHCYISSAFYDLKQPAKLTR